MLWNFFPEHQEFDFIKAVVGWREKQSTSIFIFIHHISCKKKTPHITLIVKNLSFSQIVIHDYRFSSTIASCTCNNIIEQTYRWK